MAELTIKDWNTGIGQSPATGFGQMVNVDIFSKPGFLKISNKLEVDSNSASIVSELIKWGVQDPESGDSYFVDRVGKLYKRDYGTDTWSVITGHGTSGRNGEGIAIWKDYLFYARRTRLDVYGPLSGSPSWTNNWKNLESSANYNLHPMMAAQDDFLYIGNAQYLDTLNEATAPFDPGDPASYTYNAQDLELRSDYRVVCLEELGSEIAIGTILGTSNNQRLNVGDMFFWDGTSDSFILNQTVRFAENGVQMIKNSGNVIYAIAGTGTPRFFGSVTAQSKELKRFNNISKTSTTPVKLFPGAIEQKDGEILMGIGAITGGPLGRPSPMGLYSYRDKSYSLRNLISTLRDGSTDSLLIGCVKSISPERFIVSWLDDANTPKFGVDVISDNFYTNYTAYVESPLYTVGTVDDPKTYEKIQVVMGKELQPGDGVRVKARKSLNDPWTIVATFDTTYVGRVAFDGKFEKLDKFVNAQFRVELTTGSNSLESPELKEINLTI